MRLTDFCNRLPSRAPCGSFDSRPCPSGELPGGASLDGDPPASVSAATSRDPRRVHARDPARSWWSLDQGSSAPNLPPAALSTAGRACDTTSDVLVRPRRTWNPWERLRNPSKLHIPIAGGRRPGPGAVSSKTAARSASGRLPSPSAPSPEHVRLTYACGAARVRVGSAGARHRCRCCAQVAFTTATRLPARFRSPGSPACAGSRRARPRAYRPGPSAARRLLQPNRSTSTTTDRLIPVPGKRSGPACARALYSPASSAAEASPDDLPPPNTGGAVLRRGRGRGPILRRQLRPAEVSRARSGRAEATSGGAARPSERREPLYPTRSIRTPLVMRRPLRWSETPAPRPPTTRSLPRKAEVAGAGCRSRVARADTSGAEGRFANPSAKKSRQREPEVPSIGEPDTPAATKPEPRHRSPSGANPLGDRGFPQDVASLWKTHDAF